MGVYGCIWVHMFVFSIRATYSYFQSLSLIFDNYENILFFSIVKFKIHFLLVYIITYIIEFNNILLAWNVVFSVPDTLMGVKGKKKT